MKAALCAVVGLLACSVGAARAVAEHVGDDRNLVRAECIVFGGVIAIEPADARPSYLTRANKRLARYLYPCSNARIVVAEVIQNNTDVHVAAGDTISAFFYADNTGRDPDDTEFVALAEDLACKPDLSSGRLGVEYLSRIDGAWKWNCLVIDRVRVDKAFAEFGPKSGNPAR